MKYNKQTKEKAKKKQKAVGKSSYHTTRNITQNTHLMLYTASFQMITS